MGDEFLCSTPNAGNIEEAAPSHDLQSGHVSKE
jgi:hypothetical protein